MFFFSNNFELKISGLVIELKFLVVRFTEMKEHAEIIRKIKFCE